MGRKKDGELVKSRQKLEEKSERNTEGRQKLEKENETDEYKRCDSP